MQTPDMIYACMPTYGHPCAQAAKAFWTQAIDPEGPNAHIKVVKDDRGSSLLGEAFDYQWCNALNMQGSGYPIKYFVMLHCDIAPSLWWLDQLIKDIEETKADVVSALVPLKDHRGLTSTAIDDPNDEWDILRRLSMTEAMTLPPIFTAADCGYPDNLLLANTGCWICDFTKPWRHAQKPNGEMAVSFHIRNAIRIDPEKSKTSDFTVYRTRIASEDWEFSRKIGKLGGKVMVTKNVKLTHLGESPYPNDVGWGIQVSDTDLCAKFKHPINSCSPVIDGWMSDEEGKLLASLAKDKTVLEIGSWCGLSTVWMGREAKKVLAVDTFDGGGVAAFEHGTLGRFKANMKKYGLEDKVECYVGRSETFPIRNGFDFAFIDGAHDRESVLIDTGIAERCLSKNGLLAYHDFQSAKDPGVTQAVTELMNKGYEPVNRVGSIIVLKRPAKEHTNGRANSPQEARTACSSCS